MPVLSYTAIVHDRLWHSMSDSRLERVLGGTVGVLQFDSEDALRAILKQAVDRTTGRPDMILVDGDLGAIMLMVIFFGQRGLAGGKILTKKAFCTPNSYCCRWIYRRARLCPAVSGCARWSDSGRARSKPFAHAPVFRMTLVGTAQLPQIIVV